jgi:hypothetical protein
MLDDRLIEAIADKIIEKLQQQGVIRTASDKDVLIPSVKVAELLGCSPAWVCKHLKNNTIPFKVTYVGNRPMFSISEIKEYINNRTLYNLK